MAIKNTKLGGTDWSDGDILYAVDLNDTFDGTIDYADDENGFNYFDSPQLTNLGVTPTVVRTYTFAKAIDAIQFSFNLNITPTTGTGYMEFFKNGGQIASTKIYVKSNDSDSGSRFTIYDRSGNRVEATSSSNKYGQALYINESFAATDTFEIKIYASVGGTTARSEYRVLTGINNKSTGTEWVDLT